ncbi:hypothetical protein B0H11DRAFT_1915583 [Mycena galericulata]|nr:hypothetical protein B0H11DRAFT_1915583 [Mycena galericulata]
MIIHPPDPLMIHLFCPVPAFVDRRIPRLGCRLGKAHLAAAETIQGIISSGGMPANWILLDGNQSSIRKKGGLALYSLHSSLCVAIETAKWLVEPSYKAHLAGAATANTQDMCLLPVTGLRHQRVFGATCPQREEVAGGSGGSYRGPRAPWVYKAESPVDSFNAYPLCFPGRFGKGEGHSGTAFGDTQKIRRPFPPPKMCKWPHD